MKALSYMKHELSQTADPVFSVSLKCVLQNLSVSHRTRSNFFSYKDKYTQLLLY